MQFIIRLFAVLKSVCIYVQLAADAPLPSPELLKRKILIKNKKVHAPHCKYIRFIIDGGHERCSVDFVWRHDCRMLPVCRRAICPKHHR